MRAIHVNQYGQVSPGWDFEIAVCAKINTEIASYNYFRTRNVPAFGYNSNCNGSILKIHCTFVAKKAALSISTFTISDILFLVTVHLSLARHIKRL